MERQYDKDDKESIKEKTYTIYIYSKRRKSNKFDVMFIKMYSNTFVNFPLD